MALVSHSSYIQKASEDKAKGEKMILKDDLWQDDDGNIGKGVNGGLPKGWAKGKLLARAGSEVSDLQAKEWKVKETKAKEPVENKAK